MFSDENRSKRDPTDVSFTPNKKKRKNKRESTHACRDTHPLIRPKWPTRPQVSSHSQFPVVSSRKLKNSVLNGRRMGSRAPRDRSSATHRYYHHRSITIECIMSSVFFSLLRISHRFTIRRPTDGSISLVVYRHPAAAAAHFAYTYSNIVGCRAEIC